MMKKYLTLFLIVLITISMISCGQESNQSNTSSEFTPNPDTKEGIMTFLDVVSETATIPTYVKDHLDTAPEYVLSINKSTDGIFFHLVIYTDKNIPPSDIQEKSLRISIENHIMQVEGFVPITFEDAINSILSSPSLSWISGLIYEKITTFAIGNKLKYGSTFLMYVDEPTPWDVYITLKNMKVTSEELVEEEGKYILNLNNGHTVYLVQETNYTIIYK